MSGLGSRPPSRAVPIPSSTYPPPGGVVTTHEASSVDAPALAAEQVEARDAWVERDLPDATVVDVVEEMDRQHPEAMTQARAEVATEAVVGARRGPRPDQDGTPVGTALSTPWGPAVAGQVFSTDDGNQQVVYPDASVGAFPRVTVASWASHPVRGHTRTARRRAWWVALGACLAVTYLALIFFGWLS